MHVHDHIYSLCFKVLRVCLYTKTAPRTVCCANKQIKITCTHTHTHTHTHTFCQLIIPTRGVGGGLFCLCVCFFKVFPQTLLCRCTTRLTKFPLKRWTDLPGNHIQWLSGMHYVVFKKKLSAYSEFNTSQGVDTI